MCAAVILFIIGNWLKQNAKYFQTKVLRCKAIQLFYCVVIICRRVVMAMLHCLFAWPFPPKVARKGKIALSLN
jgi:hypothetical protein